MKGKVVSFLLKMAVAALVVVAFGELNAITAGHTLAALLITAGCLWLAYRLYQVDVYLTRARARRARLRVVRAKKPPMRAA
jgi:heme A synthase